MKNYNYYWDLQPDGKKWRTQYFVLTENNETIFFYVPDRHAPFQVYRLNNELHVKYMKIPDDLPSKNIWNRFWYRNKQPTVCELITYDDKISNMNNPKSINDVNGFKPHTVK